MPLPPPEQAERLQCYRAGYTKEARRAIEAELFAGRLLGVVATNALELGVDVGSLDAVPSPDYQPCYRAYHPCYLVTT